ncbi:MAG TPA: DUF222 domain-containing protein, partial [Streptosporangiaceae bacterium]
MDSDRVIARDRVLADLAALAPVPGDALGLLVQVRQVARFADQVLGQLARLAGLVDSTGAFTAAGYASAAAFLRHGCGRSAARAGELVATGRALPRLQATSQAMDQGLVSFDAAHVISRATTQIDDDALAAAAEQEMLTAATTGLPGTRSDARAPWPEWVMPGLDPRELRRLGEDLTYRADPDAVEERQRKRFERRYLSFGITLDNVGTISGACSDALSMEIIKTAAEAFSPPGGSHDRRTAAQRRMDGLTAACQAALDSGTAGSRHGAMPHLTILLDAQSGSHLDDTHADDRGHEPGGAHAANPQADDRCDAQPGALPHLTVLFDTTTGPAAGPGAGPAGGSATDRARPYRARRHAHGPAGPGPGLPG